MTPISFPERNTIFAKEQPGYLPLPAHHRYNDPRGQITCCWHLTWRERLILLVTGVIWHQIWSFNKPLQPIRLTVEKPDFDDENA